MDTLKPGHLSGLEVLGELTVYDRTPVSDVASHIAYADIVYTNKTPITRIELDQDSWIK